jgi:radical SAM protein with 4Fe4S-binding SPASM domain
VLKADKSVDFRYNTSDPNFDFGVVWDLAREYSGNIIYSFTAPSKGVRQTVALENYRLFVPGLLKAIEKAVDCGVKLESSRPFPLCVLPPEERDEIMARAGIQVVCHPYPTANPDGSLLICSPVFLWKSEPATCMEEFLSAMREAQEMADSLQWKTPRWDKCLDCVFWHDRICQGGCLAYCNTREA